MKQCEVMVEVNWKVQHMVKYLLQWRYPVFWGVLLYVISLKMKLVFPTIIVSLPESEVSKYFSYIICSTQFKYCMLYSLPIVGIYFKLKAETAQESEDYVYMHSNA